MIEGVGNTVKLVFTRLDALLGWFVLVGRVVRRGLFSFKLLGRCLVRPDAERPGRWIAGRETLHQVVIDFGLAHLFAALQSFVLFFFLCHAVYVSKSVNIADIGTVLSWVRLKSPSN